MGKGRCRVLAQCLSAFLFFLPTYLQIILSVLFFASLKSIVIRLLKQYQISAEERARLWQQSCDLNLILSHFHIGGNLGY